MSLTRNVCGVEKIIRVSLGIILLLMGIFADLEPIWNVIFSILGGSVLLTGIVGFCPLNTLMGINTCKINH